MKERESIDSRLGFIPRKQMLEAISLRMVHLYLLAIMELH